MGKWIATPMTFMSTPIPRTAERKRLASLRISLPTAVQDNRNSKTAANGFAPIEITVHASPAPNMRDTNHRLANAMISADEVTYAQENSNSRRSPLGVQIGCAKSCAE